MGEIAMIDEITEWCDRMANQQLPEADLSAVEAKLAAWIRQATGLVLSIARGDGAMSTAVQRELSDKLAQAVVVFETLGLAAVVEAMYENAEAADVESVNKLSAALLTILAPGKAGASQGGIGRQPTLGTTRGDKDKYRKEVRQSLKDKKATIRDIPSFIDVCRAVRLSMKEAVADTIFTDKEWVFMFKDFAVSIEDSSAEEGGKEAWSCLIGLRDTLRDAHRATPAVRIDRAYTLATPDPTLGQQSAEFLEEHTLHDVEKWFNWIRLHETDAVFREREKILLAILRAPPAPAPEEQLMRELSQRVVRFERLMLDHLRHRNAEVMYNLADGDARTLYDPRSLLLAFIAPYEFKYDLRQRVRDHFDRIQVARSIEALGLFTPGFDEHLNELHRPYFERNLGSSPAWRNFVGDPGGKRFSHHTFAQGMLSAMMHPVFVMIRKRLDPGTYQSFSLRLSTQPRGPSASQNPNLRLANITVKPGGSDAYEEDDEYLADAVELFELLRLEDQAGELTQEQSLRVAALRRSMPCFACGDANHRAYECPKTADERASVFKALDSLKEALKNDDMQAKRSIVTMVEKHLELAPKSGRFFRRP